MGLNKTTDGALFESIKKKCSEINALGKQLAATEGERLTFVYKFTDLLALEEQGNPGDKIAKILKSNMGNVAAINHSIPSISEQNRRFIQFHLDLSQKTNAAYEQARALCSLLADAHDLDNQLIARLQESVKLAEYLAQAKEGQT